MSGTNHTAAFDLLMAEQPSDWTSFETYVTVGTPAG